MFSAAKIKDGRTYLEGHLMNNDYYSEHETVSGEWVGKSAERLDLNGKRIGARDVAFENFRNNRLPDGAKLTPRDGPDRVSFLDMQCSAQKSVSIMAVTIGDSRLLDAHERATAVAYAELERFAACQSNTLTERVNLTTGNLVAAKFVHTSSRALDPQVHTHFVTVAATYSDQLGGWRALNEHEMFRAIRYAGKVYQNAMASECLGLGYGIRCKYDERRQIVGFEIEGVDDKIIERYSKRREQIERGIEHFIAKHGREPSTMEIHAITTLTRDSKLTETTTPAVILAQREQLSVDERTALDALKRNAMERVRSRAVAHEFGIEQESLRRAVAHTYERACVARGHDLLAEALNQNLGGLDLDALKAKLNGPELVRVPVCDGCELKDIFVTPAGLRREQWILTVAAEDRGELSPLASPKAVAEKLSPHQSAAVQDLLSCRDRIVSFHGAAGVGKTTVLAEVDRHLRGEGREVAHCAPTASAADTLRKDGLANAVTLAAFLERANDNRMPAGSVVVVDESGLASHRDGMAVLRLGIQRDWRIIFTGDTRQHSSVDAGDFLRLLETQAGIRRVELTEIRRQTDMAYRESVRLMSAGMPKAGLGKLDELGWLREGGPDYLENAASEYVSIRLSQPDSLLCVAPTWKENHALTDSIRSKLRAAGALGVGERVSTLDPLSWTTQEKQDASRYRAGLVVVYERRSGFFQKGEMATVVAVDEGKVTVQPKIGGPRKLPLSRGGFEVCDTRDIEVAAGDRLLLRANDKKLGLINGTVVDVESVSGCVIHTTAGHSINTREYARFAHGYVTTSHKSQGMTADRVIVAAAHLDAKAAYVACSRGRHHCTLHTPDRARLLASLPTGERPLVVEQAGVGPLVRAPDIVRPTPVVEHHTLAWMPGPWSKITKCIQKSITPSDKPHESSHESL